MTRLPERVSLPSAALCLECGGLTPLFDFASALTFQTVAVAGTERKSRIKAASNHRTPKSRTCRWATGKPVQAIPAVADALRKSSEETLANGRTHGIQCGEAETAANRTLEERHDR